MKGMGIKLTLQRGYPSLVIYIYIYKLCFSVFLKSAQIKTPDFNSVGDFEISLDRHAVT